MKQLFISLFLLTFVHINGALALQAENFTLPAHDGKTVSLSDYIGKTIVLEWTNHECPFVRKHYDSGNMQALQEKYTNEGVVWLSIISSAPGNQGYVSAEEATKIKTDKKSHANYVLLDPNGDVGRLYGAETTPHMYIIDATGALVYQGGIDSINSFDKADIEKAENYVARALDEILADKTVSLAQTTSYGCAVKYDSSSAKSKIMQWIGDQF